MLSQRAANKNNRMRFDIYPEILTEWLQKWSFKYISFYTGLAVPVVTFTYFQRLQLPYQIQDPAKQPIWAT